MRGRPGCLGNLGLGQGNINAASVIALVKNGNSGSTRRQRTTSVLIAPGFDANVPIMTDAQHHPARRSRERKQDQECAMHD
jgi:hypothetical protein